MTPACRRLTSPLISLRLVDLRPSLTCKHSPEPGSLLPPVAADGGLFLAPNKLPSALSHDTLGTKFQPLSLAPWSPLSFLSPAQPTGTSTLLSGHAVSLVKWVLSPHLALCPEPLHCSLFYLKLLSLLLCKTLSFLLRTHQPCPSFISQARPSRPLSLHLLAPLLCVTQLYSAILGVCWQIKAPCRIRTVRTTS